MAEPILTHDQYEDYLENGLPDEDQTAYLARIRAQPYPELCTALYPPTGHPCEHALGHTGDHDRIIAGTWVSWPQKGT